MLNILGYLGTRCISMVLTTLLPANQASYTKYATICQGTPVIAHTKS